MFLNSISNKEHLMSGWYALLDLLVDFLGLFLNSVSNKKNPMSGCALLDLILRIVFEDSDSLI